MEGESTHREESRTLVVQLAVLTDRVEHDIERLLLLRVPLRQLLDKVPFFVVDHFVGVEGLDELLGLGRAGGDDVGAVGFGELKRGKALVENEGRLGEDGGKETRTNLNSVDSDTSASAVLCVRKCSELAR
jgi:hypothetical protein